MSDESSSAATNVMLFLLGAAVGAVVVALVTPKSGPDLREDLKDLAGKIRRKAQEAGKSLCPECAEAPEEGETGA
jgi:gas vesicle protein